MIEEVIILAGGLGTRLAHLLVDIPKPMIKMGEYPFLHYQFKYLQKYNVKKIILSVGYRAEAIKTYFKNSYLDIDIEYCVEKEPLGTGGAIQKALSFAKTNEILILNGDTFFPVDIIEMYQFHLKTNSIFTLALKQMENFDRYGTVEIDENQIINNFLEKKKLEKGIINGGTYLLNKNHFLSYHFPEKFSLEKDFFEKYCDKKILKGYLSPAYFIDIGIPEDYYKGIKELSNLII